MYYYGPSISKEAVEARGIETLLKDDHDDARPPRGAFDTCWTVEEEETSWSLTLVTTASSSNYVHNSGMKGKGKISSIIRWETTTFVNRYL